MNTNFFYKKIENVLYRIVEDRAEYYKNNDAPKIEDIPSIVNATANKCAAISGASGLIPGAWGMLASIPEIVALIKTQMQMVYDIGMAYGRKDILNPSIVMQVLMSSVGASAISVVSIQTAKALTKKAATSYVADMVQSYGVKLSATVVKSMASKWVPLLGAAVLARWSRYSTINIGVAAIDSFENLSLEDSKEKILNLH